MDRPAADRFAACLAANPRFTEVHVGESNRTRSDTVRFFVASQPASDQRYAELVRGAQDQRLRTALSEGDGYAFCLNTDSGRPFFYCFNPKSGEVHETTHHNCSCPDYHYRCRNVPGMRCKHILALLNGMGQADSF